MSETVNLSYSDVLTDSNNDDKHQFWQEAIAMQQSSGLNVRQFCRNEGLKEALFYAWRKKLSEPKENKSDISVLNPQKSLSFVEVNLSSTASFEPLNLEIDGLGILKLSKGFDLSVLKQFLKVIKELNKC